MRGHMRPDAESVAYRPRATRLLSLSQWNGAKRSEVADTAPARVLSHVPRTVSSSSTLRTRPRRRILWSERSEREATTTLLQDVCCRSTRIRSHKLMRVNSQVH
jgi:hypothetical protein